VTSSIVEGVDVVGYVRSRRLAGLVDVLLAPLLLQATEEGLGKRVVLTNGPCGSCSAQGDWPGRIVAMHRFRTACLGRNE